MATALIDATAPLAVAPEVLLFSGAGLLSLVAFGWLILTPALSAYGRPWEKAAAAFVSLFVLVALVLVGVVIGVVIVYNWDSISELFN
jgi:drug/metabolite transporter superfamily protein YnfA